MPKPRHSTRKSSRVRVDPGHPSHRMNRGKPNSKQTQKPVVAHNGQKIKRKWPVMPVAPKVLWQQNQEKKHQRKMSKPRPVIPREEQSQRAINQTRINRNWLVFLGIICVLAMVLLVAYG